GRARRGPTSRLISAAARVLARSLRAARGRSRPGPQVLSRSRQHCHPAVGRNAHYQGDLIVVARQKKATPPVSPQAKLAAVIKSARDAMRKDAGLNGDLDRIPQLAWLLFLKAFDGLEQNREVTEDNFRPA